MKINYIKDGNFSSGAYRFTEKGIYGVSDEEAERFLTTYPTWFEPVEPVEKPKDITTISVTKKDDTQKKRGRPSKKKTEENSVKKK